MVASRVERVARWKSRVLWSSLRKMARPAQRDRSVRMLPGAMALSRLAAVELGTGIPGMVSWVHVDWEVGKGVRRGAYIDVTLLSANQCTTVDLITPISISKDALG